MYLVLALFISQSILAGVQTISIKNLDLNYHHPAGSGKVEKFGISLSAKAQPSPVQTPMDILFHQNVLQITLPIAEVNWLNPFPFIAYAQKMETQGANLQLKVGASFFNAQNLNFISEKGDEFLFTDLEALCTGNSPQRNPLQRLLYDCIEKATLRSSEIDLPIDLFKSLPLDMPEYVDEAQSSKDDLALTIDQGEITGHIKIKILLKKTFRFKGKVQLENGTQTVAIRVDQVKYGIIPITGIVMRELQRRINHPQVRIDPPWIRINVSKK